MQKWHHRYTLVCRSLRRIEPESKDVAEESTPPARRCWSVCQNHSSKTLDAYGREHGIGRGKSIQRLLEGQLEVPPPPAPLPPAQKDLVRLELVKSSDPLYKQFRSRHYIPPKGAVGQQLQYLVFYGSEVVGVIGGASAVFTNQARDEFWQFSADRDTKTRQLNSVINNNVFRLEYPAPNLATMVLAMWRKRIVQDWEHLYGVQVAGFETFVVEERLWNGKTRNGACYRADNWEMVGITKGYGDTNVRGREVGSKNLQFRSWFIADAFQERNCALNTRLPGMTQRRPKHSGRRGMRCSQTSWMSC